MWKLNIEDDQANLTEVSLVRDDYSIGRDVDNAVRLTERNISRHHAVLSRRGEQWFIVDANSYNGVFVNGRRVRSEQVLAHADLIQLGDYRLEVFDMEAAARAEQIEKTATVPGRPIAQTLREQPDRLVMLAGPAVGVPFPLMQTRVVVGRGEECDLPINDTSVSRVHAEILSIGDGRYEIVDLDSSNGVRVNGAELRRALLDAGDIIELGDVQLRYVPAGETFHTETLATAEAQAGTFTSSRNRNSFGGGGSGRIFAYVAGAALLVVLVAVAMTGPGEIARRDEPSPEATASPAAAALAEAKELMRAGKLDEAVRRAEEIPHDSNLRDGPEFREIQTQWADGLFASAKSEPDGTRKRELLQRIAASPNVASAQRKRAANEIAELDAHNVDVDDLPSASDKEQEARAALQPAPPPPTKTSTKPQPRQATPGPTGASPQPSAATPRDVKGGLVRDTPF